MKLGFGWVAMAGLLAVATVPNSASADETVCRGTIRDGSFEAETPQGLFEVRANSIPGVQYDVTADGQRFIVSVPVRDEGASPLTVVLNWPALLQR